MLENIPGDNPRIPGNIFQRAVQHFQRQGNPPVELAEIHIQDSLRTDFRRTPQLAEDRHRPVPVAAQVEVPVCFKPGGCFYKQRNLK